MTDMYTINRRSFLGKIALGAGAAIGLTHLPSSLLAHARKADMPIGFQTFPIREILAKDFAGTLKMMPHKAISSQRCVLRKDMRILAMGRS